MEIKNCQHQWGKDIPVIGTKHRGNTGLRSSTGNPITTTTEKNSGISGNICSLCGAWKGQLGLEPTPELYISHLVEIFREVRRVLRKDGVVFVNCGDSYYSQPAGNKVPLGLQQTSRSGLSGALAQFGAIKSLPKHPILKPKDLCLIPFRLAIALQEDGWWVRSVIIWNKTNPMPESVTDRCTESHEYILHLTKSSRYYWDAEAVRESSTPSSVERSRYDTGFHQKGGRGELYGFPQKRGFKTKHGTTFGEQEQHHGQDINSSGGRNIRSVWTFSTQNFSGAHFATYPEELVKRCILAATPEAGCCSKCGKPWVRITDITYKQHRQRGNWEERLQDPNGYNRSAGMSKYGVATKVSQTLGWKPQCKCEAPAIPSVCLDPFAGSGTTLKVAAELNRRAIGYELSEDYVKLAIERNRQSCIL